MKATLIRDDLECIGKDPDIDQTEVREVKKNGRMVKRRFWKVGAIVTDPRTFRLVQMGVAVPADDECRDRADMTQEAMDAAKIAYERVAAGIHPDDYELFDRGVMVGYQDDGSYKPGPNYHEIEDDK